MMNPEGQIPPLLYIPQLTDRCSGYGNSKSQSEHASTNLIFHLNYYTKQLHRSKKQEGSKDKKGSKKKQPILN
jgi:hypothetical protein